jgi:Cdc6-like AAA superfamily ATPase
MTWQLRGIQAGKVFTPSSPINAQELFAGRNQQLRQIVDVINQEGQHAILYGERGVGKTSLANVFASYLEGQRVLAPRVNCDAGDTFDSVWRKAIEQAGLTQQQAPMGFASKSGSKALSSTDLLGTPAATPDSVRKALLTLSRNFIPVFVIDEFDRLGADGRRGFADLIKGLSDHAVHATILLVGVADSVEQLLAEHASVQRALAQVRMPRMSAAELDSLLEKGVQKLGMTMSASAKRRIVKLSQGLPHYAHLLALYAVRAAVDQKSLEVTPEAVASALDRALIGTQQLILTQYETAVRSARKDNLFGMVLLACAMADTNELGEFAAQDVRDRLTDIAGKRYEIPSFAQHLKEFTQSKRGPVLTKTGIPRLYRYKFTDPLLQPYVIMQGIKAKMIHLSDLE